MTKIKKEKKKRQAKKIQQKLLKATDKLIKEYGDVLKRLGKQ